MNSRSGKSQKVHHNYTSIYILTAALCVILALAIGIVSFQLGDYRKAPVETTVPGNGEKPHENPSPDKPVPPTSDTSKEPSLDPSPAVTYISCEKALLDAQSPLHYVNAKNPFTGGVLGLTAIYNNRTTVEGKKIQVSSISLKLAKPAFDAIDALHAAYAEAFKDSDKLLMITAAYALDLEELSSCRCTEKEVSDITHSSHCTGFAFDVRFTTAKGTNYQVYDPAVSAECRFLQDNAARFGLIQTYKNSAKKQEDYAHFQFVGVPHATYMAENSLTLEEYNELLRTTTNFNKPLASTADNVKYEIYFVKANLNGESKVPVPTERKDQAVIFGNGLDGYIVTVLTDILSL